MRNRRLVFAAAIVMGLVAASCETAPVGRDAPSTTFVVTTSETVAPTAESGQTQPLGYQGWPSEQFGAFTVVTGDITHAWAVVDDLVITVGGGLGTEDIKRIISSFD